MGTYLVVKWIHVSAAFLSIGGFVLRGTWMLAGSALFTERWVRIAPHVVDTILLASAIALAVMLRQYPFVQPWLTAKVVALVAYIGLGMTAFRFAQQRRHRLLAFWGAVSTVGYILCVAYFKSPLGPIG
jgi:uncharacterized membrane protein SirB2